MTKAQEFLKWLADYGSTEESPEQVVYTWAEETGQSDWAEIDRVHGDQGRWHEKVFVVFALSDGSLVRGSYLEALTENQENYYRSADWDAVESYEEVITSYRKVRS